MSADSVVGTQAIPKAALARNRSMPASVVVPVLHYPDLRAAVTWLSAAFGFDEHLRIGRHRSQLRLGGGFIMAAQSDPPHAAGVNSTHAVLVRVDDVDAHHARASAAGARIASPPADYAYGERQYTTVDPGGHVWTFSQTLEDCDPANWGGELLERPSPAPVTLVAGAEGTP